MPFYTPQKRILNVDGANRLKQSLIDVEDVPAILALLAFVGIVISLLLFLA